jgi:T5SS/PEP-CTERM-associated repeat protein
MSITHLLKLSSTLLLLFTLVVATGSHITHLLAASDNSPSFAFVDRKTLLPPALDEAGIAWFALGDGGALLVRHNAGIYVVHDGVADLLVSNGQTFPDGKTADISRIDVYGASPTRVFLRQLPEPFVGDSQEAFYRWDTGELTPVPKPENGDFNLFINDGNGRFLAQVAIFEDDFGEQVIVGSRFYITDGFSEGPSYSVTDGTQTVVHITQDGGLLVQEERAVGGQFTKRYFWEGTRSGEVATNGGSNSVNLEFMAANPAGDVLLRRENLSEFVYELLLYPAAGGAVKIAEAGSGKPYRDLYWPSSPFNNAIARVTQEGAVIFLAIPSGAAQNAYGFFTGPNPATDRFGGDFMAGFGQNGEILDVFDLRGELMSARARLDDASVVQVVGRSGPPGPIQWTQEFGGAWPTPTHWNPAGVPGPGDDLLFALPSEYTVEIDQRQARSAQVEAGVVTFEGNELGLSGPLNIGRNATLNVDLDRMQVNGLTVGNLPPQTAGTADEALLQIYGSTHFTATTSTVVGQAGSGQIDLDNASVATQELLIGRSAPGSVAIRGANGRWDTVSVAVGAGMTGTLFILDGGVLTSEETVIGHGSSPGNFRSQMSIDQGNQPAEFSNWSNSGSLTIGANHPGALQIEGGAQALIDGATRLATVAHPNLSFPDGLIDVRSPGTEMTETSFLKIEGDASLGMAQGAQAQIQISDGGLAEFGKNLNLGVEPGSSGVVLVQGVNSKGARSILDAGTSPYLCRVGMGGAGTVAVREGGQMICAGMLISDGPQSFGQVAITGKSGEENSQLIVDGVLCVGGFTLCGSTNGITGTLLIQQGGEVQADTLAVGSKGQVSGSGTIRLAQNAIVAGKIEPGVNLQEPLVRRANLAESQPERALDAEHGTKQAAAPGRLRLEGSVAISSTGVIELAIWGATPDLQSALVISGNLSLNGGALIVNFGNGYAPQRGDTFELISASGSISGAMPEVVFTGIAPGFLVRLESGDGSIRIVAENDGVSTTPKATDPIYLPYIAR